MKYTIDTENKTIEIENATMEEVVKLAKKYKKYSVVSMNNISYPNWFPVTPYYPNWYYGTGGTLDSSHALTTSDYISEVTFREAELIIN